MYYHARPLRLVEFGKIGPPPLATIEPGFRIAYEWLGRYCGFWPQVWLARSRAWITGFRGDSWSLKDRGDQVLFGFENIKGFPVHYGRWCLILNALLNADSADVRGWMSANESILRQGLAAHNEVQQQV